VSEAVPPEGFRRIAERAAKDAEKGNAGAREWVSDLLLARLATTSTALTVTEEEISPDLRVLTDEEWIEYLDLHTRLCNGDELPADDAQAYARLTAECLTSAEGTD
jgi:hypothetical protein